MKNEKQNPVVVKLSKNSGAGSTGGLHAYVVNAGGKIIETAPFKGDEATLTTPQTAIEGQSKIYIAQALPEGIKGSAKNELTLQKINAYEVVKNFNSNVIDISRLPGIIIDPFPFNRCLITGHINKNFIVDGQTKNLALCDMRVHICNVETELRWPFIPIYYRRIPDWVLHEIAQKIIALQPIPIPDPIGPVSTFAKVNRPLASLTTNRVAPAAAKPKPSVTLPENVLSNLNSGVTGTIRQTLIEHHELLFPYFCFWPIYWPWIYACYEEAVVTTDCNGHFEAWEFTFFKNNLNVYVWVEANINGQWVTVYRPPLPCYTLWDYKCGTDINITITDQRVTPCNCGIDGPADAVWFRSIGESASALHIAQGPSTVNLQGVSINNIGCTDVISLPFVTSQPAAAASPFGGGLYFQLFCGANIFASGATHYRWKYTGIADANLNPIPPAFQVTTIIQGTVTRPYLVKVSATNYETHYVNLGAVGTAPDTAYIIPNQNIALESLIPLADKALSPAWEDIFFYSAYLDSTKLTDGLYRFDLELLSQNAAGHFTVVSVARPTFQVSQAGSILDSQDAPDNYLIPQSLVSGKATSLSFNARIDNAPCVADIQDAKLVETGALSGPCGFIKYNEASQHVHLSFEASQPRNFATFSYGLVKGNNTVPTGITPAGYVISSVDGFTLSGGLFSDDFTVQTLLNGCINQAAFSENLYVASMATNGTVRLSGYDFTIGTTNYTYDASDVNAFALSNT